MAKFNILDFGAVGDGKYDEIQFHHEDAKGTKKNLLE